MSDNRMDEGFVLLYRKSLDSEVYRDANLWRVFTTCLMLANSEERDVPIGGEVIHLHPGQFITGRFALRKRLFPGGNGPHEVTVWRWLMRVEMFGCVRVEMRTHCSVVTICNWQSYQLDHGEGAQENAQENAQTFAQLAHKQHPMHEYMHEKKGTVVSAQPAHDRQTLLDTEEPQSESTSESEIDFHENTLTFWRVCRLMAKLPAWFKRDIDLAFRCGVTQDEAAKFIYQPENRKLLGNPRLLSQKLIELHERNGVEQPQDDGSEYEHGFNPKDWR